MRICVIDGCGGRHRARGWCSKHWKRWAAQGDPLVVGVSVRTTSQVGCLNPFWRGGQVTYSGAHMRVRAVRGPASSQQCGCGRAAAHWAYDHADQAALVHKDGRRYSADPAHYLPMCVPCHKVFDLSERSA